MSSESLVSVVVMCHEQSKYLHEAVGSVLEQTHPHVEVFLVCGDEASGEKAEELSLQFKGEAHVLKGHVHGRAEALNAGFVASHGKYLVRLDADDKFAPEALEKMVELADKVVGPVIVTSDLQEFGTSTRLLCLGAALTTSAEEMSLGNRVHCSSLFSRDLFVKTGGYERALIAHEDWAFWIACAKLHPLVLKVPEALLEYRVHAEAASSYYYRPEVDAVLRAAIRLLNFSPPTTEDLITVACCPEPMRAKFCERAEWFPDCEAAVRFKRLLDSSARTSFMSGV